MNNAGFRAASLALHARFDQCIGPFTTMLAFANANDPSPAGVTNNGTGFLVDTGVNRFLVTNDHVYEGYAKRRAESSDVHMLMTGAGGNETFDISEVALLGRDEEHDLAVLAVPTAEVLARGKMFFPATSWPPRRPDAEMPAFIYGYPGQGRTLLPESLGIRSCFKAMYVAYSSERHFCMADTHADVELFVPDGAVELTDLGGMSGSPVFIMPSKQEMYLAGFMYEAGDPLGSVLVRHADRIHADGTVRTD